MFSLSRVSAAGLLAAALASAQAPPAPPAPPAAPHVFAFATPSPEPDPPAPPAPPESPLLWMSGSGSYLGVHVQEVTADRARELKLSDEHGAEVTMVQEDSPAEKAGLKKGDVVLEYNGQRVEGTEQFVRFVRETPSGRTAKLTVWRGGSKQTIAAAIGTRSNVSKFKGDLDSLRSTWRMPDMPRPFMGMRSQMLGIEAEGLDGQLAGYFGVKQGVLVRSVTAGSAAEKAGLKAGDVIVKAAGKEVQSASDVSSAVRARGESKTMAISVMRDRKETSLTVSFDETASAPRKAAPVHRITRQQEFRF